MSDETSARALVEFRYSMLGVTILMAAAALHQVYVAVYDAMDGWLINACVGALLIAGIVGITRRVRWGRRIAVAFLWELIILGLGMLSPFRAGDLMRAGIEPPTPVMLVFQFASICAVALTGLHYLGKHKHLFRPAWI